MPVSRQDLHDLLEERSRPALDRPVPWDRLRTRTRAARRRRLVTAAVAGAAAASVVVAGMLVEPWSPARVAQPRVTDAPTTAVSPHLLPASFEEPDGTLYRRIATATLDAPTKSKVTFEVKVSGRPLAIMANCPSRAPGAVPHVTVEKPVERWTALTPVPLLNAACTSNRPVDVLPLPTGTATFSITMPKSGERPKAWRFGVYEWTPPGTMKKPAPPVAPPKMFGGPAGDEYRLVATQSVTWPAAREVTLTVPATGRAPVLMVYCGGGIARRLNEEIFVNGRLEKALRGECAAPPSTHSRGYTILGRKNLPGPGGTATIKVRVSSPISEYERRPGTLTVAVYDSPR
ncbi:hypothetical protein ACFQ0B_08485 [Nonomuraea thailandensis]